MSNSCPWVFRSIVDNENFRLDGTRTRVKYAVFEKKNVCSSTNHRGSISEIHPTYSLVIEREPLFRKPNWLEQRGGQKIDTIFLLPSYGPSYCMISEAARGKFRSIADNANLPRGGIRTRDAEVDSSFVRASPN
jgi:hypothetical protein